MWRRELFCALWWKPGGRKVGLKVLKPVGICCFLLLLNNHLPLRHCCFYCCGSNNLLLLRHCCFYCCGGSCSCSSFCSDVTLMIDWALHITHRAIIVRFREVRLGVYQYSDCAQTKGRNKEPSSTLPTRKHIKHKPEGCHFNCPALS